MQEVTGSIPVSPTIANKGLVKFSQETIKNLLEIDPDVKAIVSSGYSNDPVVANFKKYGFSGVILKPYKLADLKKVLHGVMKKKA
jgi:two-component system cell cycle sensor histidine kinase/response regulator CckA